MDKSGTLYIVATPIGNLQDITLRAIEVLKKTHIIACEDTRHTGNLLHKLFEQDYFEGTIEKPQYISYYEENEMSKMPHIITILKNGQDVALVSDAGTPTISDPGFKLVRECIAQGIKVESIPGPSSVLAALTSSGLPTDKFLFIGYLPKKQGSRKNTLDILKKSLSLDEKFHPTVILFEAPHRVAQLFEELQTTFDDVEVVLCRELTKLHEKVQKEKLSVFLQTYEKVNPKGECVVLFNLHEQTNQE